MCGKKNNFNLERPLERIVAGETATIHEYPWHARIQLKKQGYILKSYCGGTIISNEWILTAAHCVYRLVTFNNI